MKQNYRVKILIKKSFSRYLFFPDRNEPIVEHHANSDYNKYVTRRRHKSRVIY